MSVFVSHDGPDEHGQRAEVWVEKGVGKIVNITVPKGSNARLEIKTEGFEHPQYGWTRTDDPLYPKIVEAYESKADIQYRIESQRKRDIDRSLPIAPLRADMALAKKNTNKIFAALNGDKTLEAVTVFSEDPAPNGRIPAVEAPAAPPASAPAADSTQNSGNSAPRRNFEVEEEPPWAEFNSDGTVNFGSYSMQAAVGAELFVRKQLVAAGASPSSDDVLTHATNLLEIADKLQAYFTGKTRSRKKGSHTRVRSIVYDTVENFYPLPTKGENLEEWTKNVGRLSMERLKVIIELFERGNGKTANGNGQGNAQGNAPVNTQARSNDTAPAPQRTSEAPKAQEPAKTAPVAEKPAEERPEVDVEAARPAGPAPEGAVPDLLASAGPAVNLFAPVDISKITGPKATKENIEVFKELVTESNAEFPKVSKLLMHTFGVNKAAEVPDSVFVEFLDFYTADEDEFKTALDFVDTIR